MEKESKLKPWMTDLVVSIIATTISIVLTFGTTMLIDHNRQVKERKLTALMVMSNIETFARSMEDKAAELARKDSVAQWLLSLSVSDVEKLSPGVFNQPLIEVFYLSEFHYDKTAEAIFSSNLDTWKNLGNFQFIDNVGSLFSSMHWIEEYWNRQVELQTEEYNDVRKSPDQYPGATFPSKYLQNWQIRLKLSRIHSMREWFEYNVAHFRQANRKNMMLIGITEKEVMDFTDERMTEFDTGEEPVKMADYAIPVPRRDSLRATLPYALQVDSLLRMQEIAK